MAHKPSSVADIQELRDTGLSCLDFGLLVCALWTARDPCTIGVFPVVLVGMNSAQAPPQRGADYICPLRPGLLVWSSDLLTMAWLVCESMSGGLHHCFAMASLTKLTTLHSTMTLLQKLVCGMHSLFHQPSL